jgi:hypothetical protein
MLQSTQVDKRMDNTMAVERVSEPKHISVDLSEDEYQAAAQAVAKSGQSIEAALYSTLLVKLGAAMQGFVSENGLQNLVIDVHIETFADDITQEDLDAIDNILGDALLEDGSIDYAKLRARGEVTDLDEWESSS